MEEICTVTLCRITPYLKTCIFMHSFSVWNNSKMCDTALTLMYVVIENNIDTVEQKHNSFMIFHYYL